MYINPRALLTLTPVQLPTFSNMYLSSASGKYLRHTARLRIHAGSIEARMAPEIQAPLVSRQAHGMYLVYVRVRAEYWFRYEPELPTQSRATYAHLSARVLTRIEQGMCYFGEKEGGGILHQATLLQQG